MCVPWLDFVSCILNPKTIFTVEMVLYSYKAVFYTRLFYFLCFIRIRLCFIQDEIPNNPPMELLALKRHTAKVSTSEGSLRLVDNASDMHNSTRLPT